MLDENYISDYYFTKDKIIKLIALLRIEEVELPISIKAKLETIIYILLKRLSCLG